MFGMTWLRRLVRNDKAEEGFGMTWLGKVVRNDMAEEGGSE